MLKDVFQRAIRALGTGFAAIYRVTNGFKMYIAAGGMLVAAVAALIEGHQLTAFQLTCEALGVYGAKSALLKLDGDKLSQILEVVKETHRFQTTPTFTNCSRSENR